MTSKNPAQNVFALPGYSIPTPAGEPVASVVSILEDHLAKARSGEIRAVVIACVCGEGPNERIENESAAAAGKSWALYAALGRARVHFDKWMGE